MNDPQGEQVLGLGWTLVQPWSRPQYMHVRYINIGNVLPSCTAGHDDDFTSLHCKAGPARESIDARMGSPDSLSS
jgi:hypothetical protein